MTFRVSLCEFILVLGSTRRTSDHGSLPLHIALERSRGYAYRTGLCSLSSAQNRLHLGGATILTILTSFNIPFRDSPNVRYTKHSTMQDSISHYFTMRFEVVFTRESSMKHTYAAQASAGHLEGFWGVERTALHYRTHHLTPHLLPLFTAA